MSCITVTQVTKCDKYHRIVTYIIVIAIQSDNIEKIIKGFRIDNVI